MKKIDLEKNSYYAAKYGVSDFYDEAEQKLREAIASGEDFDTGWFGARKEINYARIVRENGAYTITVSAHMDDLWEGDDLIYDALWEVAHSEDELPEDIIYSIRDAAFDCGIDDKSECEDVLPADAQFKDIARCLDKLEFEAIKNNDDMYGWLKGIVKDHWDHMKEQEGKQ